MERGACNWPYLSDSHTLTTMRVKLSQIGSFLHNVWGIHGNKKRKQSMVGQDGQRGLATKKYVVIFVHPSYSVIHSFICHGTQHLKLRCARQQRCTSWVNHLSPAIHVRSTGHLMQKYRQSWWHCWQKWYQTKYVHNQYCFNHIWYDDSLAEWITSKPCWGMGSWHVVSMIICCICMYLHQWSDYARWNQCAWCIVIGCVQTHCAKINMITGAAKGNTNRKRFAS